MIHVRGDHQQSYSMICVEITLLICINGSQALYIMLTLVFDLSRRLKCPKDLQSADSRCLEVVGYLKLAYQYGLKIN